MTEAQTILSYIMIIGIIVISAEHFRLMYLKHRGHKAGMEQNKCALSNTERQVKIKSGYDGFPDVLILRSLLERATTTASENEETGKVLLRLRLVDDEGKPFSVTLKFEKDQIIYGLEIF